jgi:hypothetical protein
VPELNDGLFSAQPLAGRLKKVTGPQAALTLGGLTFGAVRPADLELAFRPLTSEPPIFKGELNGVPASYTVTSAFAVPGQDLAGGWAPSTAVHERSTIIPVHQCRSPSLYLFACNFL